MKTYNADGLVDHRGSRKIVEHVEAREEAPKKTLAETLEEAIARDDVRAAVAVSFGLPADASIGEVVKTAIDRDFLLNTIDHAQKLAASPPAVAFPAVVVTCAAFVLLASGVPHVATDAQGRAFRREMHIVAAADQDETSPIRLKPTATELRYHDAMRRWWK